MKYLIYRIFLITCFILFTSRLYAQTDTIIQVDTIYLPADTIKKTHTIIVYEEIKSTTNFKKRRNAISYIVGPNLGVSFSKKYPLLGGAQFTYVYNNYFASFSAIYNSKYSHLINYNKQFTTYNNYIDTIATWVDEYIQIIGTDTTRMPVYTYEYIPKTDTIKTDTNYFAKNTYRSIAIPITFGYCKKTRKYMYGASVGAQFRFVFPSKLNSFVLNDTMFVKERSYLRKMNFDALVQGVAHQKIAKNLWLSESFTVSVPLLYDFKNSHSKIFKIQSSLLFGVNYVF